MFKQKSTTKESMMKYLSKAPLVGALALTLSTAGAHAAQAQQHEHPTTSPAAQQAHPDKMKDMQAMMADPAMRQKMMAQMGQCRDMMSKMMEHMKHTEHGGQTDTNVPATPKH
jgi:hypothetical protein